jgi:3-deoxy-D-manno-octulosonic-acid transferase
MYLGLSCLMQPVYRVAVKRRLAAGKEHDSRFQERFGTATTPRPAGKVIWMHAASVGETQSLLGLIPALLEQRDDLHILLTSGTVTSAELMARDLPDRAIHQFAPVDTPSAMRAFLDHWKPDLAVWVESEIWPRMLVETKRRQIPMLLLNARVSGKTLERWKFARAAASQLFGMFDHILVQDKATDSLLGELGIAEDCRSLTGSLKSELAPHLPMVGDVQEISALLGAREHWLAASTHPGEDDILIAAHKKLAKGALLVLVPRHPQRGSEIAQLAKDAGFGVAQRSLSEKLTPETDVYVADTLGELGLWYRSAPVSFVGGSLTPIGGHNPFEPILLGSNVITGPHVGNFADVYKALDAVKGRIAVTNEEDLAQHIAPLMDRENGHDMHSRALASIDNDRSVTHSVRDAVLARLPN